jgi:hypothetical protein
MTNPTDARKYTSISILVSTKEALERLGRNYKRGFVGPDGQSYAANGKQLSATEVVELLLLAELERRGVEEVGEAVGDQET